MDLTLTPAAIARLEALRVKQGKDILYLRVTVDGGGCQGFEYQFTFDDEVNDIDLTQITDNIGLITDSVSYDFIKGSTVDFIDELVASKFVLNNPNATSSCGCGTSFNIG